jgi:hypothetical protein
MSAPTTDGRQEPGTPRDESPSTSTDFWSAYEAGDHTPLPPERYGKRWHWLWVGEVVWKRWGLGVEVSLGYWFPPELSVYLHVGPVLLGFGLEENFEWRYGPSSLSPKETPQSTPNAETT